MSKSISELFAAPRYVTQREVFPTNDSKHECEPGHCSNNPLIKPVKGCYRCSQYVKGFGGRPTCGHFDYYLTPVEVSKNVKN
jgi:hypothetical protein